jgi:hypothetical protein
MERWCTRYHGMLLCVSDRERVGVGEGGCPAEYKYVVDAGEASTLLCDGSEQSHDGCMKPSPVQRDIRLEVGKKSALSRCCQSNALHPRLNRPGCRRAASLIGHDESAPRDNGAAYCTHHDR